MHIILLFASIIVFFLLFVFVFLCLSLCLYLNFFVGPSREKYEYVSKKKSDNYNNTEEIILAFYPTFNIPKSNPFHKFVMVFMEYIGHKYGHVEIVDRNGSLTGIFVGQSIHIGIKRPLMKYDSFHFKTTLLKKKKLREYIKWKKKNSAFNYTIYLIFKKFYCGDNRFFCSELVSEAFKYADILDSRIWPLSHKISPDLLYSFLKEDLINDSPTLKKRREKLYSVVFPDTHYENKINYSDDGEVSDIDTDEDC